MTKKRKPVKPDFDAFADAHGDALANALRNRQVVNHETGKAWTWRDIRRIAGAAGISPSEMKEMTLDEMTDFLEGQRAEEDRRRQRDRAAAPDAPDRPDGQDGQGGQNPPPVTPPCPIDGHTWTGLEIDILEALHGEAYTGEALASAIGREYPTVRDALRKPAPLRKSGIVDNQKGLGYYRTDARPALDE